MSSSDSSDSSSSDTEVYRRPQFIPKFQRETILQKKLEEEIDKERKSIKEKDDQLRRLEVKKELAKMVVERQFVSEEMHQEDVPDDRDGLDPMKEFLEWKDREIKRIASCMREKVKKLKEAEQIKERSKMTDEEVLRMGKNEGKERENWNFLQRYYHRGAFYTEEFKDLLDREILPTTEDKIDKSTLPKVMQVRNFGKKGQTKYTHLVDEDTTDHKRKRDVFYRNDRKRRKVS